MEWGVDPKVYWALLVYDSSPIPIVETGYDNA